MGEEVESIRKNINPIQNGLRYKTKSTTLSGAAFIMATFSIGPGFLTQTTVFTSQLIASVGFVILVSLILDVIVQLNVWRVIGISGHGTSVKCLIGSFNGTYHQRYQWEVSHRSLQRDISMTVCVGNV